MSALRVRSTKFAGRVLMLPGESNVMLAVCQDSRRVVRIDMTAGAVDGESVRTFPPLFGFKDTDGYLWVSHADGSLVKFDPADLSVLLTVTVPYPLIDASGSIAEHNEVLLYCPGDGRIVALNKTTGANIKTTHLPDGSVSYLLNVGGVVWGVGYGAIWVLGYDPVEGKVQFTARYRVPGLVNVKYGRAEGAAIKFVCEAARTYTLSVDTTTFTGTQDRTLSDSTITSYDETTDATGTVRDAGEFPWLPWWERIEEAEGGLVTQASGTLWISQRALPPWVDMTLLVPINVTRAGRNSHTFPDGTYRLPLWANPDPVQGGPVYLLDTGSGNYLEIQQNAGVWYASFYATSPGSFEQWDGVFIDQDQTAFVFIQGPTEDFNPDAVYSGVVSSSINTTYTPGIAATITH